MEVGWMNIFLSKEIINEANLSTYELGLFIF